MTGGLDGIVQMWNVGYLVDVLARLCSQVGGSLTRAEWQQYVSPGPGYRNVCREVPGQMSSGLWRSSHR